MNRSEDVRQQLSEAMAATQQSSRPPIAAGTAVAAAVAAGVGTALLGTASDGWARAVTFVLGAALLALAFAVPHRARRSSGVHGYRGQGRRDNVVYLLVAVVLAITGSGADTTLAVIFAGLGLVVGVCWYLVLRGRLGTAR